MIMGRVAVLEAFRVPFSETFSQSNGTVLSFPTSKG
jgi:hypothetical protein